MPKNSLYTAIVAAWLTLSIASVFLSAVTWWRLSNKLQEARHAVAIQDTVDAILKLLLDSETGQRGFVISGKESFLEPMVDSEPQLTMYFDTLANLARNKDGLLEKVISLRGQSVILIDHHKRIVKVRQEEGETAAMKLVSDGKAKSIMDNIRAIVAGIKMHPGTLISDGGETQRAQLLRAGLTSLVAGVFGIGAGVIAFFLAVAAFRHQQRERELVEAKLEAERSSHEKTVFLANMSHEIRTPMNAILGFCELLQADLGDSKQRKFVDAISTSGRSLLQLINDILDMSKIEAGVMALKEEPTDPREICDFIKTIFVEPAARKGIKLDCFVAEDLPRSMLMDRIRLRQILVNLVGNAVKFTDHGEIKVRVDWEKEENSSHITMLIEVRDTGVGIPKEKLDTIFNPFEQAGYQRDKEKEGTGLGLSIVKRLTDMMGGKVTAASVPGEGSAFSLRFPNVHISTRLPQSDKLESSEPADFNSLKAARLLVVDDNEANCQLVAGLFSDTHHELEFAHNGREAVDKAKTCQPNIILMDIRMPGMDGRQALERIRQLHKLQMTPVIAVTASSLMSEEDELKRKFDGYVRKPFTKRRLYDELALFLPQVNADHDAAPADIPKSGKPQKTAGAAKDTVLTPASEELIGALRKLQAETWMDLSQSLAINECKEFADRLAALAEQHASPALQEYASQLGRSCEEYATDKLEAHLEKFPRLIERLNDHVKS